MTIAVDFDGTIVTHEYPRIGKPIPFAHQAPPSLGFSRQEHWRGLPFPSPMHEREK